MVIQKKQNPTVYYAHSKLIYDSERENKELSFLKKKFNLIDPNGDIGERGSIEPYLKVISTCNMVICSEYKEHIGRGVFEEVLFALNKGIKVFCLKKKIGMFYLSKVINVIENDVYDWKIKYGRIICQSKKSKTQLC